MDKDGNRIRQFFVDTSNLPKPYHNVSYPDEKTWKQVLEIYRTRGI